MKNDIDMVASSGNLGVRLFEDTLSSIIKGAEVGVGPGPRFRVLRHLKSVLLDGLCSVFFLFVHFLLPQKL